MSENLSTNSSLSHSSTHQKRKQSASADHQRSEDTRPHKKVDIKVEPLDREVMDSSSGFSFGRGRGLRRPTSGQQIGANSASNVMSPTAKAMPSSGRSSASASSAKTPPPRRSSPSASSDGQTPTPEDVEAKKKKAFEAKIGFSMDMFANFFSVSGNVSAPAADEPQKFQRPDPNWHRKLEGSVKQEVNPFDDSVDTQAVDEKKYLGKQYVNEVKQNERERVKQSQKEEKEELERASTSGLGHNQSPNPNQRLRHGNQRLLQQQNPHHTSVQSLSSIATDMESVGTYQPNLVNPNPMDTINETEDIGELVEHFFDPKKRPKAAVLPISAHRESILNAIALHRVCIIEGKTGCGKTTQVPQYIADDCAMRGQPFNIVVTQPRRIAAKSISKRVADEREWTLGTIVGYQIGMDKTCVNEDTRILYCTTAVLLQRLIGTHRMDTFSHIIVDEVHERGIDTDLLLLVIKKLMNVRNSNTKIILMSATFDVTALREYFKIDIYEEEELVNEILPAHVRIDERPQELHVYFLSQIKKDLQLKAIPVRDVRLGGFDLVDKDAPCVSNEAIEVAVAILETGIPGVEDGSYGSVLVFLPGLEEIHELSARLRASKHHESSRWEVHPLHSSIPLEKQSEIFKPPARHKRKVILATNIAESSITVPDVSYVIDFCLTKTLVVDIETHIPVLRLEWAAKANCEQRAGRAGRVSAGRVFRLVEKQFYDRLATYSEPELLRSPLDLSILRVKKLRMGSPKELLGLALDPPDLSDIYYSVLQLKQVGAFTVLVTEGQDYRDERRQVYYDEEDGDITALGDIMAGLPIDIRLGKLVVMGHIFDVLEDCIIIAACLSTQGMFRKDFGQGLSAYKSRLAWADRSFSDSIAYLNAYKMYKRFDWNNRSEAEKWCRQNFIQHRRVVEVDYMVGELITRLAKEGIQITQRPNLRRNRHEEELILKVVMCAAFYPNYFTRNEIEVENIPKQLGVKDPKNSVVINGLPANEGALYTHSLRELFSICSNRIDIDFEDTKAYITFLDDKHPLKDAFERHVPESIKKEMTSTQSTPLPGLSIKPESRPDTPMTESSMSLSTIGGRPINTQPKETIIKTAVYVAVAMHVHREVNKTMPKLSAEVTKQQLLKLNKFKEEEQDRWQRMRSQRVSVPHVVPRVKLEKVELPALECSEMEILITHLEDPTNFYGQYADDRTFKYLDELSTIINIELSDTPCQSEIIRVGDLVIGKYAHSDGAIMHGRAIIDTIHYKGNTKEVQSVQIFFVDYGFTQTVENIRELSLVTGRDPERLLRIPPQCFRCSLSQVNPSPISNYDGCWSKKAIDYLKQWVRNRQGDKMTAKIYSVVNRVVRVELFDNEDRSESFNDMLITIGLAEKWAESPQSRLNHDQRRNAQLSRSHRKGLILEENNVKGIYNPDDVIELEIDFNPNEKTTNLRTHDKIVLRGPYNPLECAFTGMTLQTSYRAVRIEKDSVNCIVLEPDYLSKHSRLLVASNMGLSNNSGNIALRNTTLMPNIRGFPALMAMMFAPRVQMRADERKYEFVGAICGLGFDKRTMKAYDAQYDAEIIFDSDIFPEDVVRVNIIRNKISEILKSRASIMETAENSLAIAQNKVRRHVIELLDRRRRLQCFSKYFPTRKWHESTEPEDRSDIEINSSILPLIPSFHLFAYDYYKDVEENLNELNRIIKGEMSTNSECKLCGLETWCRSTLISHINSIEHLDAVHDFQKALKIHDQEKKKEKYFAQRDREGVDECEYETFDIDSEDDVY